MNGWRRWLCFNAVGWAGFAVQLGTLELLMNAGVAYLWATAFAVEAALLHNFVWHERFTWRDRPIEPGARFPRWGRLWRFHVANGLVSLTGNVAMMAALVGYIGLRPVIANCIAVGVCAVVNYLLGDNFVFVRRAPECEPRRCL